MKPTGAESIAAERQRQIDVEGYTPEHDGEHDADVFVDSALAYLFAEDRADALSFWPWDPKMFKPTTTRRDLVKAGALIAAAIDRLDKIEAPQ